MLSTDDPMHIKSIGDGCKENGEWKEIRVLTMFRGIFYKFSQNENLTMKLLSTEDDGLFEATTDLFWGAGIGFNSKKWETQLWNGKNVTGTLLSKVRRILRNKVQEGVELNKLVFNYSLPSLQHDRSSKHYQLIRQEERCESLMEIPDKSEGGEVVADDDRLDNYPEPSGNANYVGSGDEGISDLLDAIEDNSHDHRSSRFSDQSLYTMARSALGWASRRKSHSVVNTSKSNRYRSNPPRGSNSLTRRERDFIYRTEPNDIEGAIARQAGFERNYGTPGNTWPKGTVTTSTPMNRMGAGLYQYQVQPSQTERSGEETRVKKVSGTTPTKAEVRVSGAVIEETKL